MRSSSFLNEGDRLSKWKNRKLPSDEASVEVDDTSVKQREGDEGDAKAAENAGGLIGGRSSAVTLTEIVSLAQTLISLLPRVHVTFILIQLVRSRRPPPNGGVDHSHRLRCAY